jgi:hypothetical protein
MSKKSSRRSFSIRQQKYKENRLAGMNQYNAARAAGYSEKYSKQACRVERLVKVSLVDAFERAGLTDKAIVKHALEGLNANKVISCNVISSNGEGMKDANSMTKDFVDVPDWQSRHKYFDTILNLIGHLKKEPLIDQSQHKHFVSITELHGLTKQEIDDRQTSRIGVVD